MNEDLLLRLAQIAANQKCTPMCPSINKIVRDEMLRLFRQEIAEPWIRVCDYEEENRPSLVTNS